MNIYLPSSFPKKCACGAVYQSETDWRLLPLAGIQTGMDESGKRYFSKTELRHCRCGSTLGIRIFEPDAPGRSITKERTSGNGLKHDKVGKGRYLLVVDSDIGDLLYTAMLLERFEYYPHIVKTAREAFIATTTVMPSLIITALDLSDLNGLSLIQLLRRNVGTLDIPFIILRRPDDLIKERQCFNAGAAHCLNKPVSAEVLYQAVHTAISLRGQ